MVKKICLLLAAFVISFSIAAQTDDSDITIEEAYLDQAIQIQILQAQAYSPERDQKEIALQDIATMLEMGKLDAGNSELIEIVEDLASEGTSRQTYESGRLVNDFPIVRAKACAILGQIGGIEAQRSLISILRAETEPTVMTEAVIALSKIPPDPSGSTLAVIADVMRTQTVLTRDNTFANAYLTCIEAMYIAGYEITDPTVFEEITKIYDQRSGYATNVRNKAMYLLRMMKGI